MKHCYDKEIKAHDLRRLDQVQLGTGCFLCHWIKRLGTCCFNDIKYASHFLGIHSHNEGVLSLCVHVWSFTWIQKRVEQLVFFFFFFYCLHACHPTLSTPNSTKPVSLVSAWVTQTRRLKSPSLFSSVLVISRNFLSWRDSLWLSFVFAGCSLTVD